MQKALALHLENECMRPCPRQCGEMLRGTKAEQDHRQHCSKEVVECPYQRFGCLFKRTRDEADQHITTDAKRHANMLQAERDTVRLPSETFFTLMDDPYYSRLPALRIAADSILPNGSWLFKQRLMDVVCKVGDAATLQRLIEAKCDVDVVNANGRRPVDVALLASKMECAELLIMAGCTMDHDWEKLCYISEKEAVQRWLARRAA